jgi:CheY-like chemotaxis protein/anti-sigma regulatory factor (Ser/Thr protein kinase)
MPSTRKVKKRILVVDDDRGLRHVLTSLLKGAGFAVSGAADGAEALERLAKGKFDLLLLDVGLPRVSGLEVLAQLHSRNLSPRVVMMTADDTPETLLRAVRDQAYEYVTKPFPPNSILGIVERALADPSATLPIEVVSARPEWVELLVPCALEVAERIQGFMMRLDADLPENTRESAGQAFRELLMNAVEWGGKLDPTRKVRISYLRARRMLLYRIADPGQGFNPELLAHAAVNNPEDKPTQHMAVREEKGLRPGGFGIFLVRTMVDELLYNEAHNEVVFIKYLDSEEPRPDKTEP